MLFVYCEFYFLSYVKMEKAQKWIYEYIPDEILDCVIGIMENGWPRCKKEWACDFINDFICSNIVYWKQWKITKMWLKECFEEDTKHLFD